VTLTADTFAGLQFRSLGPRWLGRVISLAVKSEEHALSSTGRGLRRSLETMNSGTTWAPVFDGEGSYSHRMGDARSERSTVVWVGTGESNSQRSVGYGDAFTAPMMAARAEEHGAEEVRTHRAHRH